MHACIYSIYTHTLYICTVPRQALTHIHRHTDTSGFPNCPNTTASIRSPYIFTPENLTLIVKPLFPLFSPLITISALFLSLSLSPSLSLSLSLSPCHILAPAG